MGCSRWPPTSPCHLWLEGYQDRNIHWASHILYHTCHQRDVGSRARGCRPLCPQPPWVQSAAPHRLSAACHHSSSFVLRAKSAPTCSFFPFSFLSAFLVITPQLHFEAGPDILPSPKAAPPHPHIPTLHDPPNFSHFLWPFSPIPVFSPFPKMIEPKLSMQDGGPPPQPSPKQSLGSSILLGPSSITSEHGPNTTFITAQGAEEDNKACLTGMLPGQRLKEGCRNQAMRIWECWHVPGLILHLCT